MPNFACFWPPISLGGGPPEFLDLHYKEHPNCDHVAKFRGDRPRELGDLVAKEKKTSAVKRKASRNIRKSFHQRLREFTSTGKTAEGNPKPPL